MEKIFIKPIEENKFGYGAFFGEAPPDNENAYLEVTQEILDGLNAHTLCWQDGQVLPYTKTAEEIAQEEAQCNQREIQGEIFALKMKLRESDYKAIKFAEGELTTEEYAPVKAERKAWREKINELELLLTE